MYFITCTYLTKKVKFNYKNQYMSNTYYNLTDGHRRGQTQICPTRAEGVRTSRGVGGMLPRKILKNRVSLMPFPAFWCGFLCMKQVTNEKKILRILVKQKMNRKIARLLSKNCPIN